MKQRRKQHDQERNRQYSYRAPRRVEVEDVLRRDMGLSDEWYARNAEVMAWSDNTERGVLTPHRFRVTLDMVTKAMDDNGIANR